MQFLIVNYRTAHETIRCVKSMVATGVSEENVIVVDNFSEDGSPEVIAACLPKVRLVRADRNGGFAAGVNLGMSVAEAKYILVLNPDTLFVSNVTDALVGLMDGDETTGIVGLGLLNFDMSPQYSARRFYSFFDILVRRSGLGRIWPFNLVDDRHLMKKEYNLGAVFEADWVMGTGFAVSKELFDRLGGMDDGYFLYMEDVDLCARIWRANRRVICAPGISLVHDHQRASAKRLFSSAMRFHLASLNRFSHKFRVPVFRVQRREDVFVD